MKRFLSIIILLIGFNASFAQSFINSNPGAYGYKFNRGLFSSSLIIPTMNGAPSGTSSLNSNITRQSALVYDSLGHNLYAWDPNLQSWKIAGGEPVIATGTTSQYWRGDKTWQTLPVYTLSGLGGVPTTRTITINGTSLDLSANRSWTISTGVPYTGATTDVDLGTRKLYASSSFVNTMTIGSAMQGYIAFATGGPLALPVGSAIAPYGTTGMTFSFNTGAKRFYLEGANITDNVPRTYTMPDASGTLALTSTLGSYLPIISSTNRLVLGSSTDNGTDFLQVTGSASISSDLTASGVRLGTGVTSFSNNTVVGFNIGRYFTSGMNNTLVGAGAGRSIMSGNNNTIIGGSGGDLQTGSSNILIGFNNYAGGETSFSNNIIIANNVAGPVGNVNASNLLNIGGWLFGNNGDISIGVSTPNTSAKLDVSSTTKGFLPPRMTTAQRTSISSPAEGLCVYDTSLHKLYVYDGTIWQAAW